MTSPETPITLKQLSDAILALSAADQGQIAYVRELNDLNPPVFGLEVKKNQMGTANIIRIRTK